MTNQPSGSDSVQADVVPYTNFRIALATAILGGGGATVAWISCLAYQARSWELAVSVMVGAGLGVAVHWLQHYAHTAIRERRGEASEHHASRRTVVALLWASGFGFVALASEHVVAHMVSEFLRPFLASLAALVPAGAIIGWSMSRGRSKDKNLFQFVIDGLLIGCAIALVTGLIWTIAFGDAPWGALVSWWGLIGIGMHLMTGTERNAVRASDPIAAVVIAFIAIFVINLLPTTQSFYDKLGAFKGVPRMLRVMAAKIQQSPDLQATFWIEAERRLAAEHDAPSGAVRTGETAPQPPIVRNRAGNPADNQRALDRLTDGAAADGADITESVARTTRADWVRSWLVIVFFALGAGLAPFVERTLRPVDYPNSETYRRDITLAISVVVLLASACVIGRFGSTHPPTEVHSS
jgi:hypothetical protein